MRRFLFFAILSALCGFSWMVPVHWLGPLLSLGLVGLVLLQKTRKTRYGMALAYYSAGSIGLLRGVAVFFGPHASPWEGAFLWLGSAALLSLGWAFANRPWKAALVLLFDALVPPLSLFDWMSPLASSGVLFPGFGVWGIAALLTGVAIVPKGQGSKAMPHVALAFGAVALLLNIVYAPGVSPRGFYGVNLHVGPQSKNLLAEMARRQAILRETLAEPHVSRGLAKVVLLPETLETAWVGNEWAIQRVIPEGQTWLFGMSVPVKLGVMSDSMIALRHTGKPVTLFSSAFPVPVSMWHPWFQGTGFVRADNVGYRAAWWTPVRAIDGVRAWADICYDQLLPFVWLEGALQIPQVILLTNNEWWAKGTGIPQIQANSSWAWARLIGAPTIEAENA